MTPLENIERISRYAFFLGLTPSQFYEMTPREFHLYADEQSKRIEIENEHADRRAALISCILANTNRDKKKKPKPFTVEDFMPKKKISNKKPMTPAVMAEILKAITIAHGGEIIE